MSDGRKNNGGARPGAGRKRKEDSQELLGLLNQAWPAEKRLAAIERVALIAESDRKDALDAVKLLLAYTYGKPIERQEVSGPDGDTIPLEVRSIDPRHGLAGPTTGSADDSDAPS